MDIINNHIDEYINFLAENSKHSKLTIQKISSILNKMDDISNKNQFSLLNIGNEELVILINQMGYSTHLHLDDLISITRQYLNWCLSVGYRSNNAPVKINFEKIDLSSNIKSTFFSSPKDFNSFLSKIFKPINLNSIENSYRMFLWLVYIGVEPKDAVLLKKTDVNCEEGYIVYKDILIKIPSEMMPILHYSLNATSCFREFIGYQGNSCVQEKQFNDPEMLVGFTGRKPFTGIQYAINHKQLEDEDKVKLSFRIVEYSGLFYRLYLQESMGFSINFDAVVRQKFFCSSEYPNQYYTKKKFRLELDYRDWKKAFEL